MARLNLTVRNTELNRCFLRVVRVVDSHDSTVFIGEVNVSGKTYTGKDSDCRRYNVLQLKILELQVHILTGLLNLLVKELQSCLCKFEIKGRTLSNGR